MPAVDLGPQAGAEAALGVQLDAVLLGQRDGQRGPGNEAALDEDRPEQASRLLLFLQGTAELVFGDEALGDQQLTKRPPGLLRSFHLPYIGANAAMHKGQSPSSTSVTPRCARTNGSECRAEISSGQSRGKSPMLCPSPPGMRSSTEMRPPSTRTRL